MRRLQDHSIFDDMENTGRVIVCYLKPKKALV